MVTKTENKEYIIEVESKNIGKTRLTEAELTQSHDMVKSALGNDTVLNLLDSGVAEHSFYWVEDETGIRCKSRPDFVRDKGNVLVEIKTTKDASPFGFARECATYKYHIQAGFHSIGINAVRGGFPIQNVIIAIENEPPYHVGVYYIPKIDIQQSIEKCKDALEILRDCKQNNKYPGYEIHAENDKGIIELKLPQWLFDY